MEDGENGAKCVWNGYIREKSKIFCEEFEQEKKQRWRKVVSSKHFQLPNIGLVTHDDLSKIPI